MEEKSDPIRVFKFFGLRKSINVYNIIEMKSVRPEIEYILGRDPRISSILAVINVANR